MTSYECTRCDSFGTSGDPESQRCECDDIEDGLREQVAALTTERDSLLARRDELLVTIRNLSAQVPYPEEQGSAAALIAEVGTLRARVAELERERDEARNRVLRPLTEREVQAALHEGRAEAMAATGDNAWTSLLTARDKLAAECERLRALVNRAADSLDYCVQRHGEHSKSVRGDELRLAAIASEGGGEVRR